MGKTADVFFYAMEDTQYCTKIFVWRLQVKYLTLTSWLSMVQHKWRIWTWGLLRMFWWSDFNTYCLLMYLHESLSQIKHVLPDGKCCLQLPQYSYLSMLNSSECSCILWFVWLVKKTTLRLIMSCAGSSSIYNLTCLFTGVKFKYRSLAACWFLDSKWERRA